MEQGRSKHRVGLMMALLDLASVGLRAGRLRPLENLPIAHLGQQATVAIFVNQLQLPKHILAQDQAPGLDPTRQIARVG